MGNGGGRMVWVSTLEGCPTLSATFFFETVPTQPPRYTRSLTPYAAASTYYGTAPRVDNAQDCTSHQCEALDLTTLSRGNGARDCMVTVLGW